jgi:hypothetical protein
VGAVTVEKLITEWGLDTDEFIKGAQKADKELEGLQGQVGKLNSINDTLGKGLRRVGGFMTASVTVPVLAAGAAMIKAASDAEEIGDKFDIVFKDQTEVVRAWAAETSLAVGRSRFDFEKWLAQLQDTFVPLGFARDRAAELSKEVSLLTVDLASMNDMADDEVLNLLTSALVGNHEAVRRFGVTITQATLEQELMRMGIKKSIKDVDSQTKAQARLNLIMAQTEDAQGNAIKTAASFANQSKKLKGEIRDVAVTFGRDLLPVAKDAVSVLSQMARTFSQLDDEQRQNIIRLAAFGAAIGPVLLGAGGVLALVTVHCWS